MRRTLSLIRFTLCCLLLGATSLAQAETTRVGDYIVHYVVVNSTFLKPEIAEQYGITRSQRHAFLNISVQKDGTDSSPVPVTAAIRGRKTNLMQQAVEIDFVEVQEGPAIYYLGEFEFSNAEPVIFELHIQPEGRGPEHRLTWDTRVYTNR